MPMEEWSALKEILKKEIVLSPWMERLMAFNKIDRNDLMRIRIQVLWNTGINDERTLKDALRLGEFIKRLHPDPLVYYIGIGNIERLNFDVIHPLLATDFSELVAVDIEPHEASSAPNLYEKFIQAVTINLSFIDDLDLEKLYFEKTGEKEFKAEFFYGRSATGERKRKIHFFCQFDGRIDFPEELNNGYDVFFSRLTNSLFANSEWGLKKEIKNKLLELIKQKGFFILEEYHTAVSLKVRKRMLGRYLGENFVLLPFDSYSRAMPENLEQRLICFMKK